MQGVVQKIELLQSQSSEPITIYIKSGGGAVGAFEKFAGLLKPDDGNGRACEFITVAQGNVKSAAAYLLLLGNYACIEKNAQLVFHGASCATRQCGNAINREEAILMTMQLGRQNRSTALLLAQSVVNRIVIRYTGGREEFTADAGKRGDDTATVLRKFVDHLGGRLESDSSRKLLYQSFEHAKSFSRLAQKLAAGTSAGTKRRPALAEARILKAIVSHELENNRARDWTIDEAVMAEIMLDYLFLKDILSHEHLAIVRDLTMRQGRHFLTREKMNRYSTLARSSAAQAGAYLCRMAEPLVSLLWHLTLSLCHRLLIGEHYIGAGDAYWLGLVDEVLETAATPKPDSPV